MNAHTVTDMSGEGFAVRLFRQGNQGGFVRAISDQPQAFAAGFSKVCHLKAFQTGMHSMIYSGTQHGFQNSVPQNNCSGVF